jgi:hypothetical protein
MRFNQAFDITTFLKQAGIPVQGKARVLGNDRYNGKYYGVVLPEEYDSPEGWFDLAKQVCRLHEKIFGRGTSKIVRGVWRTHPPMVRLYNPNVPGDDGVAEWAFGGDPEFRGRNFNLAPGEIQISVAPYSSYR